MLRARRRARAEAEFALVQEDRGRPLRPGEQDVLALVAVQVPEHERREAAAEVEAGRRDRRVERTPRRREGAGRILAVRGFGRRPPELGRAVRVEVRSARRCPGAGPLVEGDARRPSVGLGSQPEQGGAAGRQREPPGALRAADRQEPEPRQGARRWPVAAQPGRLGPNPLESRQHETQFAARRTRTQAGVGRGRRPRREGTRPDEGAAPQGTRRGEAHEARRPRCRARAHGLPAALKNSAQSKANQREPTSLHPMVCHPDHPNKMLWFFSEKAIAPPSDNHILLPVGR